MRASLLLAWSLGGCVSAASFGAKLDQYTCERQYECAQGTFDTMYGDVGECRSELDASDGALYACEVQDCAYDASVAAQCLHDLRTASCDEIVDGSAWSTCDGAFVECDDAAFAACVGA